MSVKTIARERINAAKKATDQIDRGGLWRALERLQDAGRGSNGAGIFCDISRFNTALRDVAAEVKNAQAIMAATNWPSEHDYDIA